MKPITVLGVGNILLQDEGFGVRVVEKLIERYRFPDDVQVLDGGTLGLELVRFLAGTRRLLIVDAINGDGISGTFYRLADEEVQAYFQEKVSMHELGIKDVLAVLGVTGQPVKEVVIIGVQPESLEVGLDLTPVVARAMDGVITAICAELQRWQVEVAHA